MGLGWRFGDHRQRFCSELIAQIYMLCGHFDPSIKIVTHGFTPGAFAADGSIDDMLIGLGLDCDYRIQK
jgi:hypothetical protein